MVLDSRDYIRCISESGRGGEFGGEELEYIFLSVAGKNVFAVEMLFNE